MNRLLDLIPEKVRSLLGSNSKVCLLNGRDLFSMLAEEKMIVMACNPRIKHVIPGIMRAAEELDAVVAFELTRTEGGTDGGYTGQTPQIFFQAVVDYAEQTSFSKPFIIHADHIIIRDSTESEIKTVEELIQAQLDAGFTSFALDASFNPLDENIRLIKRFVRPVHDYGYGLEVELGEMKQSDGTTLTSVEETETFLHALKRSGITPDLLAIENGSKSGNYLEDEIVKIDLERTREIYQVARSFGLAGLVQHGITGTPIRIVGGLVEFGVRKGNIGTLWQNVAHAGLPLDLMDEMRKWSREHGKDIKYATGAFKAEIDAIPQENVLLIQEMAYREAKEFLVAFRSKGSASRLSSLLQGRP